MNKPAFIKLHYISNGQKMVQLINISNIKDIRKYHIVSDEYKSVVSFNASGYDEQSFILACESVGQIESTIASYTSILEAKE